MSVLTVLYICALVLGAIIVIRTWRARVPIRDRVIGVVVVLAAGGGVLLYPHHRAPAPASSAPAAVAGTAPDAGMPTPTSCPIAPAACAAFESACAALATATPATVADALAAAHRTLEPIIGSQRWIRDKYIMFERHRFEAIFAACGVDDDRAVAILRMVAAAAIREDPAKGPAPLTKDLRDDREMTCRFATLHSELLSGREWTHEQRLLWSARCQSFLALPADDPFPGRPVPRVASALLAANHGSPVPPETVALAEAVLAAGDTTAVSAPSAARAAPTSCARLRTLHAPERMSAEERAGDPWIQYGLALAACDPNDAPWHSATVTIDRDTWVATYVVPFVNLDNERFRSAHAAEYDRIVTRWEL